MVPGDSGSIIRVQKNVLVWPSIWICCIVAISLGSDGCDSLMYFLFIFFLLGEWKPDQEAWHLLLGLERAGNRSFNCCYNTISKFFNYSLVWTLFNRAVWEDGVGCCCDFHVREELEPSLVLNLTMRPCLVEEVSRVVGDWNCAPACYLLPIGFRAGRGLKQHFGQRLVQTEQGCKPSFLDGGAQGGGWQGYVAQRGNVSRKDLFQLHNCFVFQG